MHGTVIIVSLKQLYIVFSELHSVVANTYMLTNIAVKDTIRSSQ